MPGSPSHERGFFAAGSLAAFTILLAAIVGCRTEPRFPPGYYFSAVATAIDSITGRTSACQLQGNFGLDSLTRAPWIARETRVYFSRQVSGPTQAPLVHDTLTLSLPIKGDYPDSQTVRLILGPPLNDTLVAVFGPGPYASGLGVWTCAPTLPFAGDSGLRGSGYRPVPAPVGDWHLLLDLPIG